MFQESMAAGADQAPVADPMEQLWPLYEEKMRAEGLDDAAMAAFQYNLSVLVSGANTMIPESAIGPVEGVPSLEDIQDQVQPDPNLLQRTLMLKLNGGLGTGMGLDKAKSLLPVNADMTFLDLIAKQVESMGMTFGARVAFMLMNSFSTSADTLEYLANYPELGTGSDLEFVQNKAPKVNAETLEPAAWPADSGHEWCPPGHGDLYAAILGSGTLDRLIDSGFQYMFVSNSDNLGATMDLTLLTYFAATNAPFMMEVAERTDADKKGGHLAVDLQTGGLLLRESAQCPPEDEAAFQDVSKYTYFNTNNLWVDLYALRDLFNQCGGLIPLPVMKNAKTVDPRDSKSTPVIQLETAMGAAIQCFEGATAIKIPRTRFAPVKTTNDLLALRSDAYVLTPDFRIELAPERNGVPPNIKLDKIYKFVDQMDTLTPNGVPSLIYCKSLEIKGPVVFAEGVTLIGEVKIVNDSSEVKVVEPGTYENMTFDLGAPAPAASVTTESARTLNTTVARAVEVTSPATVVSTQPTAPAVTRRIVHQGSTTYWNQYPASIIGSQTIATTPVSYKAAPVVAAAPVMTRSIIGPTVVMAAKAGAATTGPAPAVVMPATALPGTTAPAPAVEKKAEAKPASVVSRPSLLHQGSTTYWGGYAPAAPTPVAAPLMTSRSSVIVQSAAPSITTYAQPMATTRAPVIIQGSTSIVTRPGVISTQMTQPAVVQRPVPVDRRGSGQFWDSMAQQPQ